MYYTIQGNASNKIKIKDFCFFLMTIVCVFNMKKVTNLKRKEIFVGSYLPID